MTPPHSTGRRTQTALSPMKEVAWGARPRTVSAAALLGDRLNLGARAGAGSAFSPLLTSINYHTMIQLQLRRELRAEVPLELPPRQKFLLFDEGLRHHPEERRRRQHDLDVVLRWPAMAATGGGRRQPAGLHSRSDASAKGPPLLLLLLVDALATLEVLGLGRLAHSGNVVVAAVRRRPEAVVAVPGAGLAFCKRCSTTWLLEARLGWLGRPRKPLRVYSACRAESRSRSASRLAGSCTS